MVAVSSNNPSVINNADLAFEYRFPSNAIITGGVSEDVKTFVMDRISRGVRWCVREGEYPFDYCTSFDYRMNVSRMIRIATAAKNIHLFDKMSIS